MYTKEMEKIKAASTGPAFGNPKLSHEGALVATKELEEVGMQINNLSSSLKTTIINYLEQFRMDRKFPNILNDEVCLFH